jgi:cytidylate kinase
VPRCFKFGRSDIPVRPALPEDPTQVLAEIFQSWPAEEPVAVVRRQVTFQFLAGVLTAASTVGRHGQHLGARFAHCEQSEIRRREERRDPLYYRLLKSFTLGSYEGNSSVHPVETLDADSIVKTSKRAVEEAAAGGDCIIVGRGSQHFLRDRDDTLRFFLYGSKEEKIRRLISEDEKEADAQVLVDTVDRERAAFIRNYFHADWPNRSLYHAMVNTDAGDETVIQAILSFLQQNRPVSTLQRPA